MGNLLGLNGATIMKADLISGILAAAAAGFSYYEPRIPALTQAVSVPGCAKIEAERRASGMDWLPLNALEGVFELELDDLLMRAEETFRLAAQVGIPQVIAVPGKRGHDQTPALALAGETLSALVDRARPYGVSLLYELIGFSGHAFSTLPQALTLARDAGIPLVLDTFHLAMSKAGVEEIAALPCEMIGLVHLSDALVSAENPSGPTDADRVLPGEGGLPLGALLVAIGKTGYRGPISVEVFHPKYADGDPNQVAKDAYLRASAALQAAGLRGSR